ncbi:lysylphosphatidylglycerol synthase domain-containing protein [Hydrogenophaga sp.]|uniref:lysylphosphatidylglycerol synthase domain-containing protein n=1 Tax=Hydrogenophaga sp. TaxID=1904254 RepID=UPI00271DC10C|nr:lysylphosphatidylglycerol synthase domain-containing protein [Hydrogenophaga sp.]MDO9437172.1 lysylphosphatidylglycerol synthase domain-containing protein [Hydrogenophaga sp.]
MSPGAQRAWRWFKRLAPWALAAAVLLLLAQQARAVDWAAVWTALQGLSATRIAAALGLAVVGYVVYAGFDLVGRHLTGHKLSVPRTLGTAAICYVFNLNFGALVGGFAMRLRLYTRWGVAAPTVAKVIAMSMVTNWLGYVWLAGAVLLWSPPQLPVAWSVSDTVLRGVGVAMIGLAVVYVAMCAWSKRRTLRWRNHELALPGGKLALLQAITGATSWMLMGAIIWVLFAGEVAYPVALGALLIAAVAGVLTHVPAGLGVVEAVFVAVLAGRLPTSEVLAVVLAYRAIYYLLPLAIAVPAYVWSEASARRVGAARAAAVPPPRSMFTAASSSPASSSSSSKKAAPGL